MLSAAIIVASGLGLVAAIGYVVYRAVTRGEKPS